MPETPATPISTAAPTSAPAAPPGPAPANVVRLAHAVRLPSARATAMLAGAMLALGVAVGAAIGPAPDASFAGAARLPSLLPSLTALAAGAGGHSVAPAAQPPAIAAAAPSPAAPAKLRADAAGSASSAPAATSPTSSTPKAPEQSAPAPAGGGGATKSLPAVTHVWLIELSGTTFAEALAQPSAASYIDGQAVPAGVLLSGWSALDASAFAGDAALIASSPPQLLETIVQPPCPEVAGATPCATGTPGGLTAADEFLKAALPTITGTAAYRTNGLIVVTFGSVVAGTASGLPSGASSATLTSEPPAGVLLISPFASANTRPTTISFDPSSPRQSLEKLLHR